MEFPSLCEPLQAGLPRDSWLTSPRPHPIGADGTPVQSSADAIFFHEIYGGILRSMWSMQTAILSPRDPSHPQPPTKNPNLAPKLYQNIFSSGALLLNPLTQPLPGRSGGRQRRSKYLVQGIFFVENAIYFYKGTFLPLWETTDCIEWLIFFGASPPPFKSASPLTAQIPNKSAPPG